VTKAKWVEVEGLDRLIRDFDKLGDKAMPYLESAIRYSVGQIAADARAKINDLDDIHNGYLPGNLRRSLVFDMGKYKVSNPYTATGTVMIDGDKAPYGTAVELGHGYRRGDKSRLTPPHPFLRPAADKNKARVAKIMVNAMERALRELKDK